MFKVYFNWKLLLAVGLVFVAMMICAIMTLNSADDDFFNDTDYPETFQVIVDDVTYELSEDWSYNQDNRAFTNENFSDASFVVKPLEDCDQKSLKDRRGTFADDDSDGITKEVIDVDGTHGLLTIEPVNELDDYNIYFYKDNQEHIVNMECTHGDAQAKDYVNEFITGISF